MLTLVLALSFPFLLSLLLETISACDFLVRSIQTVTMRLQAAILEVVLLPFSICYHIRSRVHLCCIHKVHSIRSLQYVVWIHSVSSHLRVAVVVVHSNFHLEFQNIVRLCPFLSLRY